jgi:hypothetical protein
MTTQVTHSGADELEVQRSEIGRLAAEAPEVPSSDDASVRTRFVGVGADGFVGFEMHVIPQRVEMFQNRGDCCTVNEVYTRYFPRDYQQARCAPPWLWGFLCKRRAMDALLSQKVQIALVTGHRHLANRRCLREDRRYHNCRSPLDVVHDLSRRRSLWTYRPFFTCRFCVLSTNRKS